MSLLSSILNRVTRTRLSQVVVGSLLASNKQLCFKLLWMAYHDQRARQAWLNGRTWNSEVDCRNTQAMKQIIAQYGWPGEKLVGPMGAQATWLLAQHADHDREFQKQCHRLLESAVQCGDAQARHWAYLTDRLCVGDGVPQVYGTQLEYPVADEEHVDRRRAAVGLPPLAEYVANSRQWLANFKNREDR